MGCPSFCHLAWGSWEVSSAQKSCTSCPRAACTREGSEPVKLILEGGSKDLTQWHECWDQRRPSICVSHHRQCGVHPVTGTCGATGCHRRTSSRSLWTQAFALPTSLPCPRHGHLNLSLPWQQGRHRDQGWGGWERSTHWTCGG